ncbi:hypothetical protein HYPDE_33233 [Hyphomicrobium denitrificans 1NES1]|uniref:Uncharacterized protein n=1 Tax=Hyphomicrobium denitrificans 1NES1 TaxID=670307 RepID=N0B467_9HYPH|nr:hypothetical protein [Hyphomicrobium denitrificans]AGK58319.1 hypothetical protein HYPDE_33233 [Hyphomicrobium denitrificans 1NES1]
MVVFPYPGVSKIGIEQIHLFGVRVEVPSCVWPASVPVLPVELAFGVRLGAGFPGVRSDVFPWLPGSVFNCGALDDKVSATANDAPMDKANALAARAAFVSFIII